MGLVRAGRGAMGGRRGMRDCWYDEEEEEEEPVEVDANRTALVSESVRSEEARARVDEVAMVPDVNAILSGDSDERGG